MAHPLRVASSLSLALALAACAADRASSPADGLHIAVAPLSLPGITDACYDLAVYNATTPSAAALVWSQDDVCASRYGDGRGSIAYVGTCDASVAGDNLVTLALTDLYEAGQAPTGTPLATSEYQNPCPTSAPCALRTPCVENADAPVTFNLTIMRDANQGFFDIAVTFEDVFCSAKVDCQTAGGDDLLLAFDPATGARVPSIVLGFACTGGVGADTWLWIDGLSLVCGGETIALPIDNDPAGNVYDADSPAPAPLVQVATYRGRELLTDADGESYAKLYANATLGLDKDAIASDCRLTTTLSASDGELETPFTTPLATTYPLIEVNVPLWSAATHDLVCTQHPLNDPDAPAGEGVFTTYTAIDVPQTFAFAVHTDAAGAGVEVVPAGPATGVAGHVFAATSADATYAGQPGIAGVTVRLFSDSTLSTIVGADVTDALGAFRIRAPDGSYVLELDLPTLPSGAALLSGNDLAVTVSGALSTVDFAVEPGAQAATGAAEGRLFADLDGDGAYAETVDIPLDGITVRAIDLTANTAGPTTTTGAGGLFSFGALTAGHAWRLDVDPLDPSLPASHLALSARTPANVTVAASATTSGVALALPPSGDSSLVASVALDLDGDGELGAGDAPLDGQVIELGGATPTPSWWAAWEAANGTPARGLGTLTWSDVRPWGYHLALDTAAANFPAGGVVVGLGASRDLGIGLADAGPYPVSFLVTPGSADFDLVLEDVEAAPLGQRYDNIAVTLTPDPSFDGELAGDASHTYPWWPAAATRLAPRTVFTEAGVAHFGGLVPGLYKVSWDEATIVSPGGPASPASAEPLPWAAPASPGALTTFTARYQRYQQVRVTAFADVDHDGTDNDGAGGVEGTQLTLASFARGESRDLVTGANGQTLEGFVASGDWRVDFWAAPLGFEGTPTWQGCGFTVTPGADTYECLVPLWPTTPGTVTVFEDDDGDGLLGPNEAVVPNAFFDALGRSAPFSSYQWTLLTQASGSEVVDYPTDSVWDIVLDPAGVPAGYLAPTSPACTVTVGASAEPCVIALQRDATVTVDLLVYADDDGIRDPADSTATGIPGVPLTVASACPDDTTAFPMTTGADGRQTLTADLSSCADWLVFIDAAPEGYAVYGDAFGFTTAGAGWYLNLVAGETHYDVPVPLATMATVTVRTFADTNDDGIWQPWEPLVPNVEATSTTQPWNHAVSVVTDELGSATVSLPLDTTWTFAPGSLPLGYADSGRSCTVTAGVTGSEVCDVPVLPGGLLQGTVDVAGTPTSGVAIDIIDLATQDVVAVVTTTDTSGDVLFTAFVPLGTDYTARIHDPSAIPGYLDETVVDASDPVGGFWWLAVHVNLGN